MMNLSTERLNLRPVTETDIEKIHELNSLEETQRLILQGSRKRFTESNLNY